MGAAFAVNGVTTSYVYDGQDIAASITSGSTIHYVHGPEIDEHLALVQSGAPYFVHVDGLGSVTGHALNSHTKQGGVAVTPLLRFSFDRFVTIL